MYSWILKKDKSLGIKKGLLIDAMNVTIKCHLVIEMTYSSNIILKYKRRSNKRNNKDKCLKTESQRSI
jgi:hypothetical protein